MSDQELEPEYVLESPILNRCVNIYKVMDAQAIDKTEGRVWSGAFTSIFNEDISGVPLAFYTQISTRLVEMGCIQQIRRGAGKRPSIFLLLHPPTPELFRSAHANHSKLAFKKGLTGHKALEQRINDLFKVVKDQELEIDKLKIVVRNIAFKLSELEAKD